jgi:lysozyme family protein
MATGNDLIAKDFPFQRAVEQILRDEGGSLLTDDPRDPGGRTKYGITQKLLNAVWPGKIVDTLTEDEAKGIYYDHFWKEYRFDTLPERVGAKMFNFCVTAGPRAAFLCLQRGMRANGVVVKDDGVMGPITRGLLMKFLEDPANTCAGVCMIVALKSEIAGYYRDLDSKTYEDGWVNRAYRG